MSHHNRIWISLLILLAAPLAGCATSSAASPVTKTATASTPTPTATATRTPTRTATVTPSPTPLIATVKLDAPDEPGIYSGPSVRSEYRGKVPFGKSAVVLGRSNRSTWIYVEYEGSHGFAWFPWFDLQGGDEAFIALPIVDSTTGLPIPSPTLEIQPSVSPSPTATPTSTSTPDLTVTATPTATSTPRVTATPTYLTPPFGVRVTLTKALCGQEETWFLLTLELSEENTTERRFIFTVNGEDQPPVTGYGGRRLFMAVLTLPKEAESTVTGYVLLTSPEGTSKVKPSNVASLDTGGEAGCP